MAVRVFLLWLPMVAIAIANGTVRQLTYGTHVTELAAHQISSVTAIILLGGYIWVVYPALRLASAAQAVAVGAVWLVLTVAFEFSFGHFAAGHSWAQLLRDYDLLRGRVWALVLLWVAAAPALFFGLRGGA